MNEPRPGINRDAGDSVSRDDVRSFYSKAAVSVQESLCCPADYNENDLSHIPEEVRNISYGCGSPVNRAQLKSGETMVDLGSGGGIDCFIASRYVGQSGKVVGVDMTDEMLETARKNARKVGDNLGFHNVEFKQGFLESIPMEDESVDLVTSNCVINLSTQKKEVFKEIFRILKPGGRFVIADIISDKQVPEEMRKNQELWGECVSGALTLAEFQEVAQSSEFAGITLTYDYLWKEVEGIKFYSYILKGYKPDVPEGASCCKSVMAIYAGPYESVTFEDQTFLKGVPVEVDEIDASYLSMPPYAGNFHFYDPETEEPKGNDSCCA